MSKYHENCTKVTHNNDSKNKCSNKQKLTSKPFCDCENCLCSDCPDILRMFSITVTENSCVFGPKVKKSKHKISQDFVESDAGEISDLMGTLTDDEDCSCEVVARALKSNFPKNLGLTERRTHTISSHGPETQTKSNNNNVNKKTHL